MCVTMPSSWQWCAVAEAQGQRGFIRRFLISGATNTALTYLLYLGTLDALGHRLAYTLAFPVGLVLVYTLNRHFVFRTHAGWRSVLAMPMISLMQYLVGLGVVEAWVRVLGWPATLAPLAAIGMTVPMSYLLSRKAFVRR